VLFELLAYADPGNLHAVNTATGTIAKVTHSPFQSFAAAWSPDARTIVFSRATASDVVDEIYAVNGDGSHERRLSTAFQDEAPVGRRTERGSSSAASAATTS
jgi:Tol biopolymer transport system component